MDWNYLIIAKKLQWSISADRQQKNVMTYIKPSLKGNPDRSVIHVGRKDLRSNPRYIVEVANNSKTDTNQILISSVVLRRDNLNGKGLQVTKFLKKFCMENDFDYVNHDTFKPGKHCNYGGIHLNTLGSKILVNSFVLALNTLTWHRMSQENDALDKDNPETESNSKFSNSFFQDNWKIKVKSYKFWRFPLFFVTKSKKCLPGSKNPKRFRKVFNV